MLLDEPLGALDLKLRKEMQVELSNLHRQLGITFVMVTHDQEEALSLSNRIAVMKDGDIEQVGTPSEIYDHPRTPFVADFIGDTNLLRGEVNFADAAVLRIQTLEGTTVLVQRSQDIPADLKSAVVSIRPEKNPPECRSSVTRRKLLFWLRQTCHVFRHTSALCGATPIGRVPHGDATKPDGAVVVLRDAGLRILDPCRLPGSSGLMLPSKSR